VTPLLALALAQQPRGLILMARDPSGLLTTTPQVAVTDTTGATETISVTDDGLLADMTGGDGTWSGAGRDLVGPDYRVTVSDGERTWVATLTAPRPNEPSLHFELTTEGSLVPVGADLAPTGGKPRATAAAPSPESAVDPATDEKVAEPPAVLASRAYLLGWLGALGVLGWLLAGPRGTAGVPAPHPGARPSLPGQGLVFVEGDAEQLIGRLAGECRVVLAGRPPTIAVPHGTVFVLGPGRVHVDDALSTLRSLGDRGPDLVLVVTGRLEAQGAPDQASVLSQLARHLPSGVTAYVFHGERPSLRVVGSGDLEAIESPSATTTR